MTHGHRLQPIASPTSVESTCWYAIYSASTPSFTRSQPNLPSHVYTFAWAHLSVWATIPALHGNNGPPFASNELAQFLQHHHIGHITSSLHFPRSNGFIEWQVCTIKTMLSTSQDSRKTLEDLLLDMWSTPIGPNMPFPGRSSTIQPSSTLVDQVHQSTWRVWGTASSPESNPKRHSLIEPMAPLSYKS